MKHSSGIIPYKIGKDNEVYFFLGHPGGPYMNKWAYLKGGLEEGEDNKIAAIREFKEESGVSLEAYKEDFVYIGKVKQNPTKIVSAFTVDLTGKTDINPKTCYSNLCDEGWPEMDDYAWLSYGQVKVLTNQKHMKFYDKIIELISNSDGDNKK